MTFEFSKKGFEQAKDYKKVRFNLTYLIMLSGTVNAFVNIISKAGV